MALTLLKRNNVIMSEAFSTILNQENGVVVVPVTQMILIKVIGFINLKGHVPKRKLRRNRALPKGLDHLKGLDRLISQSIVEILEVDQDHVIGRRRNRHGAIGIDLGQKRKIHVKLSHRLQDEKDLHLEKVEDLKGQDHDHVKNEGIGEDTHQHLPKHLIIAMQVEVATIIEKIKENQKKVQGNRAEDQDPKPIFDILLIGLCYVCDINHNHNYQFLIKTVVIEWLLLSISFVMKMLLKYIE